MMVAARKFEDGIFYAECFADCGTEFWVMLSKRSVSVAVREIDSSWVNSESVVADDFPNPRFSDELDMAENVAAEFKIETASLDLEDLWIHAEAAYDDHVADCWGSADFSGLFSAVKAAKAADKAGGERAVVRAILRDAISSEGCPWRWDNAEQALDILESAVSGKLAYEDIAADNYAALNSLISAERLQLPKERITDILSRYYSVENRQVSLREPEDFLAK